MGKNLAHEVLWSAAPSAFLDVSVLKEDSSLWVRI
jgi:hypothetical protein